MQHAWIIVNLQAAEWHPAPGLGQELDTWGKRPWTRHAHPHALNSQQRWVGSAPLRSFHDNFQTNNLLTGLKESTKSAKRWHPSSSLEGTSSGNKSGTAGSLPDIEELSSLLPLRKMLRASGSVGSRGDMLGTLGQPKFSKSWMHCIYSLSRK